MSIRKIGGIHFFRIGRYQFSFCIVRTKPIHTSELCGAATYDREP